MTNEKGKTKISKKKNTPHNFRDFFILTKNDTNATNAKAVCICCCDKNGGLQVAQLMRSCYTTNKAKLCRKHLANCDNFKNAYSKEEVSSILARPVPEDFKKNINHGN
jgi:hypothetical protein